jgi:hypothetical protein
MNLWVSYRTENKLSVYAIITLGECRMLAKHEVKSDGMPPKKISSFIRPVKDELGLHIPSTYIINCKKMYIGQTDRSTETRMKEHHWHIQPGQPE